ncbi:TPA: aminotransferase class V-fold PLP-dependent enzyme [Candidatus Woesearchaeota archaeon]|nr:aminotransferase class V-fold PLP-dependent enzyme [Candidatus Woesearchaeota archaeon]
MIDTEAVRRFFPFLQKEQELRVANPAETQRVFVDSGASTHMPLPVLEKIAESLFRYANVHRGAYDNSQHTTEEFERAYNVAANLVNAASWREIIFTRGTTEAINVVAYSLLPEFRDGDNVVVTRLEHNSNYVPWYGVQQRLKAQGINIEIKVVDFDLKTGELDMPDLEKKVNDRTKILAMTGASNFLGVKPDIKRAADIAHSTKYKHPNDVTGTYVLVDGAQLVPGSSVDVQELGCDFLAWSFHKMLLPAGVGCLYGRQHLLESMEPFNYGGDMIFEVKEGEITYNVLPWKFTAGTPNILGTIAATHGISFLINAGLGNLGESDEKLIQRVLVEIMLNTPKGDFEIGYEVAQQHHNLMRGYFREHTELQQLLRDPSRRVGESRIIVRQAMAAVQDYEQVLTQAAIDRLREVPGVILYGTIDAKKRTGLIAFNVAGIAPKPLAVRLGELGVEARDGVMCASLANQALGLKDGGVRFSFNIYTNTDDVYRSTDAVKQISKEVGN